MKKHIPSLFSPKSADVSRSSGLTLANRAVSVAMAAVISLVLCFPLSACSSNSSSNQSENEAQKSGCATGLVTLAMNSGSSFPQKNGLADRLAFTLQAKAIAVKTSMKRWL